MPRVVHFEIHADEPQRALQFYSGLFGWRFNAYEGPMPYWLIITGSEGTPGINGGLMKRMHPLGGNDGVIAFVCTVDVDNLDRYVACALELGASVALPKMPIPGVGWLAYVRDTEGNVLGLMQPDPTAS